MNLFYIVIIINLSLIITLLLIFSTLDRPEKEEIKEERENMYMKLLDLTTNEIKLIKNKKEFEDMIEGYSILSKFFTDNEIINKYYPNYKRLD